jgi:predicted transglutaminase-like cysteine proteinase
MDRIHDTLADIHKKVFNHFTYETDQDHYGVLEKWVMPVDAFKGITPFIGDCEDYALACRKLCNESVNPLLPSRLVVCSIGGEGHCVLECQGWIMCCNQPELMSRDDLEKKQGYTWLYISGFHPNDSWHRITG